MKKNHASGTLRLWPHQATAVETCRGYFASRASKSALVHLPTGTGKTGVISVLASDRARIQPVLVISPSSALVEQLVQDISQRFWTKISAPASWRPDVVDQLLPSNLDSHVLALKPEAGKKRFVICATVQAMQQIFASSKRAQLQDLFGTVLFDEGHREPAPEWAKAVRSLSVPTVLFSATPYRNDLKLFDVDDRWVSFLSFSEAVERKRIRDVEVDGASALDSDYRKFARQVISIRQRCVSQGRFGNECKVIVRADSEDSVKELFQAFAHELRNSAEGVLAIHNNFDMDGRPGKQIRGDVPPSLAERTERFLIHQHMLTEGIDDPECAILALYDGFSNERQLVQQVGRLTRHPNPGRDATKALVIACKGRETARSWHRFLAYDKACIANGGRAPIRKDREVLERLIAALPEFDYADGKFRTRVNLLDGIDSQLRFPKSAVIYDVPRKFKLDTFQAAVSAQLNSDDRFECINGSTRGEECRYHVSLSLTQSPYLEESMFQAATLEVTIYVRHDGRLFFYDSGGLWMDESTDGGNRLRAEELASLLPEHSESAVTSIAIRNADLGPVALRSRSMTGKSLATSGVFVGEQTYVVGRAVGRHAGTRRALTFFQGRLRQEAAALSSADEYCDWVTGIARELDEAQEPSLLFGRYATPAGIPRNTAPLNVLIDVDSIEGDFVDDGGRIVAISPEDSCVDIKEDSSGHAGYTHSFGLRVNDETHEVWIKWDREKKKYWLSSPSLGAFKLRENPSITLTHRLNQQQPFRLIPDQLGTLYAYGRFYSIDLKLSRPNGPARLVLELLEPIPQLRGITSEKGDLRRPAAGWPKGSLFEFIDQALVPRGRGRRPFGGSFEHLVCDDIGPEAADFVGINETVEPRVALIAAKWRDGTPGVSASKLADVCGQAVKNLGYLRIDSQELPGSFKKLATDWTLKGGRVPRCRAGAGGSEFRQKFVKVRSIPRASREMWLVLGGGVLSKAALKDGFKSSSPRPHVLQTFQQLLSVLSLCQSVGVTVRIFCSD